MQALVLEKVRSLQLRDITIAETLGPHDVRVRIHTVGVCGGDGRDDHSPCPRPPLV